MGETHLFDWLIGLVTMVFGFLMKKIHADVSDNTKDIQNLRNKVAEDYISKEDYREDMRDVKEMLKQIMHKIESKADKSQLRRASD